MQVLSACNLWSVGVPTRTRRRRSCVLSRREICFDGMSSVCSHSQHSPNDAVTPTSGSTIRVQDKTLDFDEMVKNLVLSPTRRVLVASLTMFSCLCSSRYMSALALGDPSVTLEEVTPPVFSSGPLFPIEDRIVQLFERNTYSVVNIFDVTLRPQLNITGVVEIPEGNGSGVVWDQEGHIVTNYHVVGNALSKNPKAGEVVARVNILASEGLQKNFEGVLIGADRLKDLAVLKVDAPKDILRPIKVGQSSSLKVGQQCLAIGNPFGFDHTLTVGVISGLNRDIFSQTGVTIGGGVQTDAAINPGNSGGPLLNSKGSLIGINTAIFTQTGTSAGVGFAIPSSTVLRIVPQLIQFGKVPANSLAAKAGLNPTTRGFAGNIVLGDIIVAVDNKPVKSKAELLKALDEYNVGDKVVLMVQRGSEKLELPVVLEEQSS
ncbi:protease Do-like 8, chloroplastic isoform X3 [Vigna angularis]|uniref:protease Do-like 8, chloroplastic isoform X3 n=1 Tax=Phaseolus angularis TaxID=3914 RepID=UPI00080A6074|nr:protease Do-like 8, chloroplastic isoform X3 [Vigna angularis]